VIKPSATQIPGKSSTRLDVGRETGKLGRGNKLQGLRGGGGGRAWDSSTPTDKSCMRERDGPSGKLGTLIVLEMDVGGPGDWFC